MSSEENPHDPARVLHDLRDHRVDVEAQNEELRRAHADLEAARALYYDLAPVGYCNLTDDGKILEANLTFARQLGLARSALEGQSSSGFIVPEDHDAYGRFRQKLLASGEPQTCELRLRRTDGSMLWVQLSSIVSRDNARFVERMVTTDITERKLLQLQAEHDREALELLGSGESFEETLAALIRSYEALIPGMQGSILLLDGSGQCLHHAIAPSLPATWVSAIEGARIGPNSGSCGTAVYTQRTVIVEDVSRDPRWTDYCQRALRNGLHACWSLPIFGTSRVNRAVVGAFACYFGAPRAAHPQELQVLERGARLASLVIDREAAARVLADTAATSRAVLDSMASEIAVLDASGTIVEVNEPWHRVAVQSTPDAAKQAPNSHVGANYITVARTSGAVEGVLAAEGIEAVLNGRVPRFQLEYPCHSPSEQRWFMMTASPLGSKSRGVVVAHTDVTERKQAEAEKEKLESQLHQAMKMQSIGRLAGGVAHDFNNMLAVILGHAELAATQLEPGHPLYDDLEQIRAAAQRSAELTQQLLAFARKQIVDVREMSLNEAIERMLSMLPRLLGEDIRITWKPDPHAWPIRMDPTQIDQILTNLCVNARDAIVDVGEIVVATDNCHWEGGVDSSPGDYVRLTVTDNGVGMSPDVLAQVFEPFFTTKPVGTGTGLGLATVYGIVRQGHGFITVASEPGRGTRFEVHFPRYVGAASSRDSERLQRSSLGGPRGTETVLVVEDEPSILRLTARILEQQGYRVLRATRPNEALLLVQEHGASIRLLITDVVMPEMNGRALLNALAALIPDLRCLFMSGYTADVITPRGVRYDGMHFLEKPFSKQALATKVREALDAEPPRPGRG